MKESERQLATLCARGDPAARKELYLRYATRLHLVCRRYADNAEDATDLLHDAFIKAFDKIGGFRPAGEGSLYAWLRKLTVNLALDRIRRSHLSFIPIREATADTLADPTGEDVERIPLSVILEMVSSLSTERRTVFNLFCIDGWSHREIARALGISEKGSAAILWQARKQLKEKINDYLTVHS